MPANTMIVTSSRVIPEQCFTESTEYADKSPFCQQFYLSPTADVLVNICLLMAVALLACMLISVLYSAAVQLRSYFPTKESK